MDVFGKALAAIQDVSDDEKFGPHGGFTAIASTSSTDRDDENLWQEEWKTPLPDHITIDSDHGMNLASTIGSAHPYFNTSGQLMIDAKFSSIARAQEARTLVKEGHIRTVSVAFLTDKAKKSGEPRRELLNVGLVAIPANPEAQILDSKALDLRAAELAQEKLESKAATSGGGDRAMLQAAHDAIVHVAGGPGNLCVQMVDDEDPTGAQEGANKSADEAETKDAIPMGSADQHTKLKVAALDAVLDEAEGLTCNVDRSTLPEPVGQALDLLMAAKVTVGVLMKHLGIFDPDHPNGKSVDEAETKNADDDVAEILEVIEVPEDSPLGQQIAAFEERLDEVLKPEESPAESPAEEVPAPADEAAAATDEAADDAADELALETESLRMQLSLLV